MNFQKIEKEEIIYLHFQQNDVLLSNESKIDRERKLNNAATLGNINKQKCKIIFKATEGVNYVETTIWAVTDKYICLKGGITLLIASVFDVVI
jgi:hypothetical protein